MASDITDEFQIDITNQSEAYVPSASSSGISYDVAFNDMAFFEATSPDLPYRRQTAPYKKDQNDNSSEPGEQTFAGWWLRSQSSFHYGAGAKFYEPAQDQNLRFRFAESEGVNVFDAGSVELLNDVDAMEHPVLDTNVSTLRSISSGVLLHDGGDLDKVFDTVTRTVTNKALTSNVATLTTSVNHGFTAKMYVVVSIGDPVFDGEYTITSVTSNTFSYAKTNDNVTSTAATGTAKVSAVHYVDYTGTGEYIYSVCDDGTYAYWIANKISSGLKWHLKRKPISGDASSTADETELYLHTGQVSATSVIEYVKDRLVFTIDNTIYKADVTSATSVTPSVVYTHGNVDFKWTSITESPSDIYLSGYEGGRSVIHRITYAAATTTDDLPTLISAVVVAEFPRGEIVHSIKAYLGYMIIGTSRGVRIAVIQSDGSIVYGPLLFESEQPVYQIATADRFAWVTTRIGGDTGLIRIDLGTQIDTLVFPYANDLQAVGSTKVCTGVSLVGNAMRLAFTSTGSSGKIYFENLNRLRQNGFIKTGLIRFNTTEDKFFKYVKERASYGGGSISIATPDSTIITVDASNGNTDIGIPEKNATERKQFIFTLNRDSTDVTAGPVFYGYQVKALPATRRQRMMQYNLFCFDNESDRFGNRIGYDGRAFDRVSAFETLESTSDIVTVQDFKTGETFSALIEECSFMGVTSSHKNFSGFGGILTVTVRKI